MSATAVAPEAGSIIGRAMLVNVHIAVWEARKHDRKITQQVNAEHAASRDAGRYHKHLFGGKVKTHNAVLTAAMDARAKHYEETLPWSNAGWRLLPTDNYLHYTEIIRAARARFEGALEEFMDDYPRLRREAKERLNGMYQESDYPTPAEVRRKFTFRVDFEPLPSGDDFRLTLPQEVLADMAQNVESRVVRATQDAMADTWGRLADAVQTLNGKLSDGKYLRETMVTRIQDVADALGRLNVTGDPHLEEMRQRAARELSGLDVEVLREDEAARAEAAKKAGDILKSMQGLYGGNGAG